MIVNQLWTEWGENIDPSSVLTEYPREQLRRNAWVNLNGYWEYAFTKVGTGSFPSQWEGKILVPFSPESALSGVQRQLQPMEWLWYGRKLPVSVRKRPGFRILLHFGAVDQSCVIYVNKEKVFEHSGGYLPFTADITEFVSDAETHADAEDELIVRVRDLSDTSFHTRGNQSLKNKGRYHTAVSGIWQTVWLEEVPDNYVEKLDVRPDPESGYVSLTVHTHLDTAVKIIVHTPEISINTTMSQLDENTLMQRVFFTGRSNHEIRMRIPHPHLWTVEAPWLYRMDIRAGEDMVSTYFALRTISIEKDEKKVPRICLNHEPIYLKGAVDPGLWPDGLYTAPADAAIIFDLTEMKRAGFNMVRKTAKIEPDRWYYHCDRLGILVWQDIVNGGERYKDWYISGVARELAKTGVRVKDQNEELLSRKSRAGKEEFRSEIRETAAVLQQHPSIACWTLFDEGRGQFETEACTDILHEADPERRPVDSASGWMDQGCGEIRSIHAQTLSGRVRPEKKRAFALSAFGGLHLSVDGHVADEKRIVSGKKYHQVKELRQAYRALQKQVEQHIPEGLCASAYVQWTDSERETDGIYTWDRKVKKI